MKDNNAQTFPVLLKHLFLAISLLISFNPNAIASCTYPNDPGLAEQQQQCDSNNTGAQRWDCNLNRCVNTVDAVEDRQEYKECLKKDEADQKQCFDDFAKSEAAEGGYDAVGEDDQKGKDTGALAINTIFAAMVAINLVASDGKGSNCTSANIAGVTAAGGILAYFYLNMMAKKKVDKLRDDYKDEKVNEGDAFNAQVRAFEYLKSEQQAVADYAKARKTAYTLLAVGYAAAFGFAIYDAVQGTCGQGGEGEEGSDKTAEGEQGGEQGAGDKELPDSDVFSSAAAGVTSFTGFMNSPAGVMIIAGLGVSYSGFLAAKAGEQQDDAEENIKKIDKVLAKFQDSVAGYCPNGRESLSEPRCFCYLDDGSQNKDRSNSQTCQSLWAADNKNYNVAAGDYGRQGITETKGCMFITRKFDADCECRKLINSKGQNACFKSNFGAVGFNGLGQSLGTPSFARNIDSLASGSTSFGNLNNGSLAQQATRSKSINDQLLKKSNLKLKSQGKKPLQALSKPLIDKFTKKLATKRAINEFSKSQGTIQASRPASGKLAEALKKAVDESGIKKKGLSFKKSGRKGRKRGGGGLDFKFVNESARNARDIKGFANNNKNYDYKENDIVNRDDVSIWQVISHRYNRSGMKRLFGDDTITEPSAADE